MNGAIGGQCDVIYKDYTFQNVAIDTSYNSIYYKGGLNIAIKGFIPISATISSWGGGMSDLVVPYISQNNQNMGVMSKSNITVATLIVRVAYVRG